MASKLQDKTLDYSVDTQKNVDPAIEYHEKISGRWHGRYEKSSFGERAKLISSLLQQAINSSQSLGHRWLDAGCGAGNLSRQMVELGLEVTGVDASAGMLSNAEQNVADARAEFRLVDSIECLPFADESFDGVLCSSVIEYVPAPEKCLAELSRVLKPGGQLIVTVPYKLSLIRFVQKTANHISRAARNKPVFEYIRHSQNAYHKEEIAELLSRNSMKTVHSELFAPLWPTLLRGFRLGSSLIAIIATKA